MTAKTTLIKVDLYALIDILDLVLSESGMVAGDRDVAIALETVDDIIDIAVNDIESAATKKYIVGYFGDVIDKAQADLLRSKQ